MAPTELEITAGSGLWGLGVGESDHLGTAVFEGLRGHSWRQCLQQLSCLLRAGNPKADVPQGAPPPRPSRTPSPIFRSSLSFFRFFYSVSPKHLCFFFYTDSVVLLSLNVLCTRLYISSMHKDYAPSIGSIATELRCPLDTRGAIPV